MKATSRILLPSTLFLLAACGGPVGGASTLPGGGDPTPTPGAIPDPPYTAGLLGAAGGPGLARVDYLLPGVAFEAALFAGESPGTVYDGSPVETGLSGSTTELALPAGSAAYVGLGVRRVGDLAYVPAGAPLFVREGAPLYVDAAAPAGGDGKTPATAFNDLFPAVLTAFAGGGGNVWVRDGVYAGATLPIADGVNVHGGFDASFTLAGRDTSRRGTIVHGFAGAAIFDLQGVLGNGLPAVLDGLILDGERTASVGLDVGSTAAQIRSCTITRFFDRGVRMRNSSQSSAYEVVIANTTSSSNGADGVTANGAYDLTVYGSSFESNVQEGIELDDLVALEGKTARLRILSSRFVGNGSEGVDADLGAPLIFGPGGGHFDVDVIGSRFELNALDGLRIDHDFELTPGWTAEIQVREVVARSNLGAGVFVDADGPGEILLHRVISTANQGDGFTLSSETQEGVAVVSASVFAGNFGAGIRAAPGSGSPTGNQSVLATHCVFTGNVQGGIVSNTVRSSAASSVAYLQANAWQGTRTAGSPDQSGALPAPFLTAAEAFDHVVGRRGTTLDLASGASVAPDSVIELADDGSSRSVDGIAGRSIEVGTTPEVMRIPALLSIFGPGSGVVEDYRLAPGSTARDAGLTPPGGAAVDAGIFGSPVAGEPGVADEVRGPLFRVTGVTPSPAHAVGASGSISVFLSDDVAAGSLPDQVRVFVQGGGEVAGYAVQVLGSELSILAPAGGWGTSPVRVEIHRGLSSTSGVPLSTPVIVPLDVL